MKKKSCFILLLCGLLLSVSLACKPAAAPPAQATTPPALQQDASTPAPLLPERTGLGVSTNVSSSASATDNDGKAQTDAMVAAVTVDSGGRITDCRIDGIQAVIGFSREGKLTTKLDASFPTKQERGADYGMGQVSSIGREWNQQADALAAYVLGKTADEVRGIAVTGTNTPADADLAASCTISIGGYLETVAKAAEQAADLGAVGGNKLGLGCITGFSESADAVEKALGSAQADTVFAVVTLDSDGRVTSCVIDANSTKVTFDTAGQIASSLTAAFPTKNEQRETYGMKEKSAIGKEWYEQAAAFADYCKGKNLAELNNIAMEPDGTASEEALKASVTIHIGDFIRVVTKAAENAS